MGPCSSVALGHAVVADRAAGLAPARCEIPGWWPRACHATLIAYCCALRRMPFGSVNAPTWQPIDDRFPFARARVGAVKKPTFSSQSRVEAGDGPRRAMLGVAGRVCSIALPVGGRTAYRARRFRALAERVPSGVCAAWTSRGTSATNGTRVLQRGRASNSNSVHSSAAAPNLEDSGLTPFQFINS